mmetsp:Transcript_57920/g.131246  ORF Transcript_57920/g.131246 Transcript_57920/m.131246 type:complete len:361 (+) Transcript_57920:127-1209(+)
MYFLRILSLVLMPGFTSAVSTPEESLAKSYVPIEGATIRSGNVKVGKASIAYLASGPTNLSKQTRAVVFCHGAAFTSRTWQIVGVLDELGAQGYPVIAPDMPGYGASTALPAPRAQTLDQRTGPGGEVGRDEFLGALLNRLGLPARARVVVVSASMGGTFAAPFVASPSPYLCDGYVTVAGLLPQHFGSPDQTRQGGKPAWRSTPQNIPPALVIFGSEDPKLRADRTRYETAFPRHNVVVFDGAPHPAYLRDRAAANLFTSLVLQFVKARPSSALILRATSFTAGSRVETNYFRGKTHNSYVPATITKVFGDRTYSVALADGDLENRIPQANLRPLSFAGKRAESDRSETMPELAFKATW